MNEYITTEEIVFAVDLVERWGVSSFELEEIIFSTENIKAYRYIMSRKNQKSSAVTHYCLGPIETFPRSDIEEYFSMSIDGVVFIKAEIEKYELKHPEILHEVVQVKPAAFREELEAINAFLIGENSESSQTKRHQGYQAVPKKPGATSIDSKLEGNPNNVQARNAYLWRYEEGMTLLAVACKLSIPGVHEDMGYKTFKNSSARKKVEKLIKQGREHTPKNQRPEKDPHR